MTNRRQPASSAARTLSGTARARDASTTRSAPARAARVVTAAGGPAEDLDGLAAGLQRRADRPPERAVAENDRGHRWCLLEVGAAGAFGRPIVVADESKGRGHRSVRGPWSLRARRLDVGACCAPSEPLGPCLPAGPPELLLRLVGEKEAAHVHTMHLHWNTCNPLRGLPFGAVPGEAKRGLPRMANPVDSRGPRPAVGRGALAVALAQSAEHRIVAPKVTGSIPVGHPNLPIPAGVAGRPDRLALRRPSLRRPDAKMTRR